MSYEVSHSHHQTAGTNISRVVRRSGERTISDVYCQIQNEKDLKLNSHIALLSPSGNLIHRFGLATLNTQSP